MLLLPTKFYQSTCIMHNICFLFLIIVGSLCPHSSLFSYIADKRWFRQNKLTLEQVLLVAHTYESIPISWFGQGSSRSWTDDFHDLRREHLHAKHEGAQQATDGSGQLENRLKR